MANAGICGGAVGVGVGVLGIEAAGRMIGPSEAGAGAAKRARTALPGLR